MNSFRSRLITSCRINKYYIYSTIYSTIFTYYYILRSLNIQVQYTEQNHRIWCILSSLPWAVTPVITKNGELQTWHVVSLLTRSRRPQRQSKLTADWEQSKQAPQHSLSNKEGNAHRCNEKSSSLISILVFVLLCVFCHFAFATNIWHWGEG